ncbi:MAG: phosphomannomutase/phosphoglucomutase [Luteitalea sp.]|nr:phosphomannomutase/phosphoglucomutase [Luteitalea sp.]
MPQNDVAPEIFKAYDIRGIYPDQINEAAAHDIGGAFAYYLAARRIGVGRDMRLSSPGLTEAFIEGARQQGCDVIDYGMIATDMLYYAVCRDKLDGGAEITASHNSREYNGMKLVRKEALPLSAEAGIDDIKEMVLERTLPPSEASKGGLERREILDAYLEHVFTFIDVSRIKPFHVVLDAGNGIAGLVAPRIFERLPCKVVGLCMEVDGTFPNHEANPLLEENRRDIMERVERDRADIGIAWDGDADRCFFIDGTGQFVPGDFVTALIAESFLHRQPGQTIVYDVRASYAVKETVAKYGGTALMNRVGHAFIKQRMRKEDAIFGGEVSGHYYFRHNFYADNGFIPALVMLELMSRRDQTLAELVAPLRKKYFLSGEISVKLRSVKQAEEKIRDIARRYTDATVYSMDGISIEYPDWHFNVRPSNTEPLLRLNLEGKTPELMAKRRDEVLAMLRS